MMAFMAYSCVNRITPAWKILQKSFQRREGVRLFVPAIVPVIVFARLVVVAHQAV
jgi:hypothetical protein